MADTILVVVEQREGKLNRVSWETLAAGQALAASTGWNLEAAVLGSGVAPIANEVAGKKVGKVYDLESPHSGSLHSGCVLCGSEAVFFFTTAAAGPDAAYIPGSRFYSQAGDIYGTYRHQRLHRFPQRRRQAALYASDVSGEIRC